MFRRAVLWPAILCMVLSGPVATAGDGGSRPRNIILIGWDGAQRDHVNECLDRGELPNLKRLTEQGTYVSINIEGATDTKAGWSQILTGYYPKVTGVYSNRRYRPVPKGLSIFERLEKHFGKDEFVTVAVIGKRAHCGEVRPPRKLPLDSKKAKKAMKSKKKAVQPGAGNKPTGRIIERNGKKYWYEPGSPYYQMHTALEVWEYGLMQDKKVGSRAIELLERYKDKPFFFFVHFAEVDHSGHQHGENSRQYNDALISNDFWTGRIMDKLRQLGLAQETQIYITADHGFDEGGTSHSFAPYVFLASNNQKICRNGRRQDIAPTILEAFGLDLRKIQPPLDGISLTRPDNRPPAKLGPRKNRRQEKQKRRQTEKPDRNPDVIFVPTPQNVVEKMLELAEVKKDDLVYDLGCGDGRIVVTAAKKYGCRAVGYDIDPQRVKESLENVEKNNVTDLAGIEQRDIFTLDLSRANVITLYLLPSLNVKLIPQLEKLKPGSRIVSHDFAMEGVRPDKVVKIVSSEGYQREHTIYLWTTPLKKEQEQEEETAYGESAY